MTKSVQDSVVTLVESLPDGMRYGGSIGAQGPYPESLAKHYVAQAGERYEPSNGSEGEAFWSWNCCRCERDKDMNGTCHAEGRDPGDDDWCPILAASFRGEAKEWVYGANGQPTCTAFVPMGQPIPAPRCEHTADMFSEPSADASAQAAGSTQTGGPANVRGEA